MIQQDNARPHLQPNDLEFTEAAKNLGIDVRIDLQPPNSPDLNVLDLGYFNSIQSLQHTESPKNIVELINVVNESYDKLEPNKLLKIFLTLQTVMEQILLNDGGNEYKLVHMSKSKLEREGRLPESIRASDKLLQKLGINAD